MRTALGRAGNVADLAGAACRIDTICCVAMKNRAVTEIEAEQMFRYWRKVRENGGFTRVAAKFGRNRKTIHAMANKYDWPGRDKNIKDAVRDDQEKKEIRSAVRLADICKGLSDVTQRNVWRYACCWCCYQHRGC